MAQMPGPECSKEAPDAGPAPVKSKKPTDTCTLPKKIRKTITPLDEDATAQFLGVIKGHRFEYIYLTTVFTGMRRGEVCGLTWGCGLAALPSISS